MRDSKPIPDTLYIKEQASKEGVTASEYIRSRALNKTSLFDRVEKREAMIEEILTKIK